MRVQAWAYFISRASGLFRVSGLEMLLRQRAWQMPLVGSGGVAHMLPGRFRVLGFRVKGFGGERYRVQGFLYEGELGFRIKGRKSMIRGEEAVT